MSINYEIKQGINGSGNSVFFIYWADGMIDGIDFPYKSEAEALANAETRWNCGNHVATV